MAGKQGKLDWTEDEICPHGANDDGGKKGGQVIELGGLPGLRPLEVELQAFSTLLYS
jgi:hypothetical protein